MATKKTRETLGYCIYYGAEDNRDRESYRSFNGIIKWLEEHGEGFLRYGNLLIERESFDEELWEKIED